MLQPLIFAVRSNVNSIVLIAVFCLDGNHQNFVVFVSSFFVINPYFPNVMSLLYFFLWKIVLIFLLSFLL